MSEHDPRTAIKHTFDTRVYVGGGAVEVRDRDENVLVRLTLDAAESLAGDLTAAVFRAYENGREAQNDG